MDFPPRSETVATKSTSTPALMPTTAERQQPLARQDMNEEEAAITNSFVFLDGEDDDDDSDGEGVRADDEAEDDRPSFASDPQSSWMSSSSSASSDGAQEALDDFNFLNNFGDDDSSGGPESRSIATTGVPTPAQGPLLQANDSYRENYAGSDSPIVGRSRSGKKVSARPGRSDMKKLLTQLAEGDQTSHPAKSVSPDGGSSGQSALQSLFGSQPGRKSPSHTGKG